LNGKSRYPAGIVYVVCWLCKVFHQWFQIEEINKDHERINRTKLLTFARFYIYIYNEKLQIELFTLRRQNQ
jgi:cytosine/uracil/thiamine/allantoin permease